MSWKAKQIVKIDRTSKKPVGIRWEFRRYDMNSKRYERVPVLEIPPEIRESQDSEKVAEFCKLKNAEINAVSTRKKATTDWKHKYPAFDLLLAEFAKYQVIRAPNSWENDLYYLQSYVMKFFTRKSPSDDTMNILNWHLYYEEFRQWLSVEKPLKWQKKNLALNTQNRIIKALNVFLNMVGKKVGQEFPKCPTHNREELNQVTADDIFSQEEIKNLQFALKGIRPDSYDLFTVLVNTALRTNEVLGMCLPFVMKGHLSGSSSGKLHEQLQKYNLGDYFGYICLESQPILDSIRTSEDFTDSKTQKWKKGSVPRKPLKSRRKIEPKWFRFIPIFEREAWNVLVRRYNEQIDLLSKNTHGRDERDYLLFDNITASMFYQDLVAACEVCKIRFRSPHKLRHTFLTWFYTQTNEDRLLARKVGGHEDERSMRVYSHLAEQIGLEQKRREQGRVKMDAC